MFFARGLVSLRLASEGKHWASCAKGRMRGSTTENRNIRMPRLSMIASLRMMTANEEELEARQCGLNVTVRRTPFREMDQLGRYRAPRNNPRKNAAHRRRVPAYRHPTDRPPRRRRTWR